MKCSSEGLTGGADGQARRGTSFVRWCGALAIAGGVGLGATLAAGGAAGPVAADPAPESTRITLSMSVDPGQAVPLDLITEDAAAALYAGGFYGQGIDVALVDSGVAPVPGLDQPDKLVYGPDLSAEGSQDNLANLDTYGHGTHLAGIIAGDDGDQVGGIAPASRVVSVKVAGATGETDVAQVIAGIDWVVEHKDTDGLNIRVLNLSLGVDGLSSNVGDPLSAAVERAWDAGIVVVAAVGNRGNEAAGVDSPAVSPYVVAVGGTESFESSGQKDQVASWSSKGNGHRNPDVVAPGRSILSFRVPGSMLDQLYPEAVVGDRYFRGTGTSQSAAVVSGFTAALLSADPGMSPDQVKFLFQMFAQDVVAGTDLDGHGRLDADQVFQNMRYKAKAPPQQHTKAMPSSCTVSDEAVPVDSQPVLIDETPIYVAPVDPELVDDTTLELAPSTTKKSTTWYGSLDSTFTDSTDVALSNTWSGSSWDTSSWGTSEPEPEPSAVTAPCGPTWSGGGFNGATWSGGSWSGATWSGATWSGATWSSGMWSGATWSGATWSGATWSGATWSGATWSGATWSGAKWSGKWWSTTSLSGSTWS